MSNYSSFLGVDSLTIAGHTVTLGGTQDLAASDLTNGTAGSGAVVLASVGLQHAANNAALEALPSIYATFIIRDDYATGNGAPPLVFKSSASAPTINGGAGDNCSQVLASDGGSWLAVFPASGVDVRQAGAVADSTTDYTGAFQIAANAAIAAKLPLFIPGTSNGISAYFKLETNPVIFTSPPAFFGAAELEVHFAPSCRIYYNAAAGDCFKFDGTTTRWNSIVTSGSGWIEPYNGGAGWAISIYSANHISIGNTLHLTNQDTGVAFNGLLLNQIYAGVVYDPYVDGAIIGMEMANTTNSVRVLGGEFGGCTSYAYYSTGNNDANSIDGTYFEGNTGYSVYATGGQNFKVINTLFNDNSGVNDFYDDCSVSQHQNCRFSLSAASGFTILMNGSSQSANNFSFFSPISTSSPLRLGSSAQNGNFTNFVSHDNPTGPSGLAAYYSDASSTGTSTIRNWQGPGGEVISNKPMLVADMNFVNQNGVANATWTTVAFDNPTIVQGARCGVSAGLVTPNLIGKYLVTARVGWDTVASGTSVGIGVAINGTLAKPIAYHAVNDSTGGGVHGPIVSGIVQTTSLTDTISVQVLQNSSSDQNINGNSNSTYIAVTALD